MDIANRFNPGDAIAGLRQKRKDDATTNFNEMMSNIDDKAQDEESLYGSIQKAGGSLTAVGAIGKGAMKGFQKLKKIRDKLTGKDDDNAETGDGQETETPTETSEAPSEGGEVQLERTTTAEAGEPPRIQVDDEGNLFEEGEDVGDMPELVGGGNPPLSDRLKDFPTAEDLDEDMPELVRQPIDISELDVGENIEDPVSSLLSRVTIPRGPMSNLGNPYYDTNRQIQEMEARDKEDFDAPEAPQADRSGMEAEDFDAPEPPQAGDRSGMEAEDFDVGGDMKPLEIGDPYENVASDLGEGVDNAMTQGSNFLKQGLDAIKGFVGKVRSAISSATDTAQSAVESATETASSIASDATKVATSAIETTGGELAGEGLETAGAALDATGVGAPIGAILNIIGAGVLAGSMGTGIVGDVIAGNEQQSATAEAQDQLKQATAGGMANVAGRFAV